MWIQDEVHKNQVLSGENFYISYNNSPIGSNVEETALCSPDGEYYILNGDYRKKYEELIDKGFETCLEFYKNNIENQSIWSSDANDYEKFEKDEKLTALSAVPEIFLEMLENDIKNLRENK